MIYFGNLLAHSVKGSIPQNGSMLFDLLGRNTFYVPTDGQYSFVICGKGGNGGSDYYGNAGGAGGGGGMVWATLNLLTTDTVSIVHTSDSQLIVNGSIIVIAKAGTDGTSGNTDRAGTGGSGGGFTINASAKIVSGTTGGSNGVGGGNGGFRPSTNPKGGNAGTITGSGLSAGQLVSAGSIYGKGGDAQGGWPTKKPSTTPGKAAARVIWGSPTRRYPTGDIS